MLTPTRAIVGGLAIAGSIAAYKKGYFKKDIKKALEFISNSKPTVSVAFNDLRKWLISDEFVPEKSVFRLGIKGTLKEFAKFDLQNTKEMLMQTKSDWGLYLQRVDNTLDRLMEAKGNVYSTLDNTELLEHIKFANKATSVYSSKYMDSKKAMLSKIYDDIFENNTLSVTDKLEQLKRKGYRSATINDLYNIEIDDKTKKIKLVAKDVLNFDNLDADAVDVQEGAIKKIEDMLNHEVRTKSGFKIQTGDKEYQRMYQKHGYKNLVVDKNIMVDETGHIIDIRNQKMSSQEFIRNLSTEWQIPIIGVNPLRLFGLDKIGRHNVKYATIDEKQFAPALTGVRGNQGKTTIEDLKKKIPFLKDVNEGITIINGDAYTVTDNGIKKINYKSKKEIVYIPRYDAKIKNFIRPSENSFRKMAGLSMVKRTKEDFNNLSDFDKTKRKIYDFLDLGNQESRAGSSSFSNLMEYSNPDSYLSVFLNKIKPKNYKSETYTKHFSEITKDVLKDDVGYLDDAFLIINKSVSLKDVKYSGYKKHMVKNYFKQYIASFENNPELVNRKTGIPYFLVERMNQSLSSVGLGLSLDSTKSTFDTAKNLLLKRFLPVYAAYQGVVLLGGVGDKEDEVKKPTSIQQKTISAVMKTDIGFHKILDATKISKGFKKLSRLTPGSDQIGELPGIDLLNLSQTAEDRDDYWKYGEDAVRKGRFWSAGDTPFTGGRIDYYKPNAYRMAMSNYRFSDTMYGSKLGYLNAKINPFAQGQFDKYHHDDRPYLITSAPFSNVPLVGPLLSSTVGRIIDPPRKMHLDYWKGGKPLGYTEAYQMELKREEAKMKAEQDKMKNSNISKENLGMINVFNNAGYEDRYKMRETSRKNILSILNVFKLKSYNDVQPQYSKVIDYNEFRKDGDNPNIYRTPSGSIDVIDLGLKDNGSKKVNYEKQSVNRVFGVDKRYSITSDYIVPNEAVLNAMYSNPTSPYSISTALSDQYKNTANVAGIYGFAATGFITGEPGGGNTVIETSAYARSFNRDFENMDIGGLGGDISEIFRRFVQFKRKDVNYYNPIRNTMPDWLPGHGAFTDFTHGDPYAKVKLGEVRLPGKAYEKAHGIKDPLELGIGSSHLGKGKEAMVNHFLHNDLMLNEESQSIVSTGNRLHEKIEKEWLKQGIAIDVEGKIDDKKNNIVGWYDARVYDDTSATGDAIVDIKTVNAKTFSKIKSTGKAKFEHQAQVNYYLHATGRENANGYIYYVNRDNPNETMNIKFGFSKGMLKKSLTDLKDAREEIYKGIKDNTIQRGDLYSPMDRFRILASVAPYSDEFNQQNSIMTQLKPTLSEDEQKEIQIIRKRVQEQKKPLRTYDYRFLTANVKKGYGKISRKIDSNTFLLSSSQSIKLAGIDVVSQDNENYEAAMKFLSHYMGKGKNITFKYDADEVKRKNNDVTKSMSVVVYSNGVNVNRKMIKLGYAKEKEDDYSPTAVHARFNLFERMFGRTWERMAHQDTMINDKILQVRSAAEDYKRKQVYGKDFKDWKNPISDFVMPSIWRNIDRPTGVFWGGLIGYMLGSPGSKYGKLLGAVVGATTVSVGKVYKHTYETVKKEKWIPKEKREIRNIEEYIDKLKFVKNRKLFEEYAKKALVEDNIDVKEVIENSKRLGDKNKREKNKINKLKEKYTKTGKLSTKELRKYNIKYDKKYDSLTTIGRGLSDEKGRKKLKELFIDNTSHYDAKLRREAKKEALRRERVNETEEEAENRHNLNKLKRKQSLAIREKEKENERVRSKKLKLFNEKEPVKKPSKKRKPYNGFKERYEQYKDLKEWEKKDKKRGLRRAVNSKLENIQLDRKTYKLSYNAMKAIEYYNNSEQTMYGYDPGEPITNFLKALPKKDRIYFNKLANAPEEERKKILNITPKYMRRALQSAYKMKVDEKESLVKYFSEHNLPDENWRGWDENVDLNSLKVKIVQKNNLNFGDFNIWQQDKVKADMQGKIPIPIMGVDTRPSQVANQLQHMLGKAGYKNLKLSYSFGGNGEKFKTSMKEDVRQDVYDKIQESLGDSIE